MTMHDNVHTLKIRARVIVSTKETIIKQVEGLREPPLLILIVV